MSKTKPSELSNEELLKNEKTLKVVTYILAGVLLILFIANILVTVTSQKGFSGLRVAPIALFPIVIINLSTLKEIKNEIKARGLS